VILPKWDIKIALDAIPRYVFLPAFYYVNAQVPSAILIDINRYKITFLTLIPSVVHQLVNYPGIEKVDLSSVISAGSGAAYLPPELGEKLSKLLPREARFVEGYGMSEAVCLFICLYQSTYAQS